MKHVRLNTIDDFSTLNINDTILIIDKDNEVLNAIVSTTPHKHKLTPIYEMWVDVPKQNLELPIEINKYLNHVGWFKSIFKED